MGQDLNLRTTGRKVCLGSDSEVWGDPQDGLLPGVKLTKSGPKRTPGLGGRLLGAEQTYPDQGLNSRL